MPNHTNVAFNSLKLIQNDTVYQPIKQGVDIFTHAMSDTIGATKWRSGVHVRKRIAAPRLTLTTHNHRLWWHSLDLCFGFLRQKALFKIMRFMTDKWKIYCVYFGVESLWKLHRGSSKLQNIHLRQPTTWALPSPPPNFRSATACRSVLSTITHPDDLYVTVAVYKSVKKIVKCTYNQINGRIYLSRSMTEWRTIVTFIIGAQPTPPCSLLSTVSHRLYYIIIIS